MEKSIIEIVSMYEFMHAISSFFPECYLDLREDAANLESGLLDLYYPLRSSESFDMELSTNKFLPETAIQQDIDPASLSLNGRHDCHFTGPIHGHSCATFTIHSSVQLSHLQYQQNILIYYTVSTTRT